MMEGSLTFTATTSTVAFRTQRSGGSEPLPGSVTFTDQEKPMKERWKPLSRFLQGEAGG
jgi:hypothetical protein